MEVEQTHWTAASGWVTRGTRLPEAQLVLFFASPSALEGGVRLKELSDSFPKAKIVGCSTGGEILDRDVYDESLVATALKFDSTNVVVTTGRLQDATESHAAGLNLGKQLPKDKLRLAFVLSDGTRVNGSELVSGLREALGTEVTISGGLAGDGARFGQTLVGSDGDVLPGKIVVVGFYGDSLRIGHGSVGGWEPFGPERLITKSEGNVLHEIDGQPALDLYKRYLGDEAEKLPGSALLFPLCLRRKESRDGDLVRTILSIDEDKKTMTFAGDVPEGGAAQLMRGSLMRLVSGAGDAAEQALGPGDKSTSVALLVSCIGRKLLLGQRSSEEVEAVGDVLGDSCNLVGFYSYGEISPHSATGICELHNQTMTITTLSEG